MRLHAKQPIGTVSRARELRRNAPEAERRLLRALRASFPAVKWRHQTLFGPFYADILCFSEKLVIEVDGDSHAESATPDAARASAMARHGYRTLRAANADVMGNLDGVIAAISLSLRERKGAPEARKGEGDVYTDKGDHA